MVININHQRLKYTQAIVSLWKGLVCEHNDF